MADFNLQNFLQNYKSYDANAYTAVKLGKQRLEEEDIERAASALQNGETGNFLKLTLTGKLEEIGVGPRVVELVKGTAVNAVKDIVNPFADYLAKNQIVFDEKEYKKEITKDALQMYYTNKALQEAAPKDSKYIGDF